MGCTQSTDKNDQQTNNNNQQNAKNRGNANGPADAANGNAAQPVVPKTNPHLSLSAKDIYSLKASWKAIRRSMEETGVLMFVK